MSNKRLIDQIFWKELFYTRAKLWLWFRAPPPKRASIAPLDLVWFINSVKQITNTNFVHNTFKSKIWVWSYRFATGFVLWCHKISWPITMWICEWILAWLVLIMQRFLYYWFYVLSYHNGQVWKLSILHQIQCDFDSQFEFKTILDVFCLFLFHIYGIRVSWPRLWNV